MKLIENPINLKNDKVLEKLQETLKGEGLYLSSFIITSEGKVEEGD